MTTTALAKTPELVSVAGKLEGLSKLDAKQLAFLKRQLRQQAVLEHSNNATKVLVELIKSPVFAMVLGFTLVEALQKWEYMGTISGTVLEGALVSNTLIQSLGSQGILDFIAPLLQSKLGS